MAAAVLTLNTSAPASIGRPAARHLPPRDDLDERFFTALRVFRFQHGDLAVFASRDRLPHGFDGVGLVVLDRDDAALCAGRAQDESEAVRNALALLDHLAMIRRQKRLALCAVEDHDVRVLALRHVQLDMRGKRRAAHAAQPRRLDSGRDLFRIDRFDLAHGRELRPFIPHIALDRDAELRLSAKLLPFLDRGHGAGYACVYRDAQSADRLCDDLSDLDGIPLLHAGRGGRADVHSDRDHDVPRVYRPHRRAFRRTLALVDMAERMHAAFECLLQNVVFLLSRCWRSSFCRAMVPGTAAVFVRL